MHGCRFPGQGTGSMYRHKPFAGVGDKLTVDDVAPSVIEIVIVISLIMSLDERTCGPMNYVKPSRSWPLTDWQSASLSSSLAGQLFMRRMFMWLNSFVACFVVIAQSHAVSAI